MKLKNKILILGAVCAILISLAQSAYADGKRSRGYDDDHHGDRNKYYRYQRYYPSSYYFRKKIYSSQRRAYYYYFDIFPNKTYYYSCEKTTYASNTNYLPVTSIVNMASQGVPSAVIISEIERTKSKYKLETDTITYLQQKGASDQVIDYMLSTDR